MKKFSTPTIVHEDTKKEQPGQRTPSKSTMAFLRQFARAYRPAPAPTMPGFVLN